MSEQPKKVFSLLQLLQSVSRMVAKTYEHSYWIKAEITKINEYKYSGHCYPELVEKQNGKIVAQVRAIIWAKTYQSIKKNFEAVVKEPLKEGMTVVLLGQISFDPLHGIALNIQDIDPSYTLGDMMRERNAAIDRLKREGLFEKNKRLSLPVLPRRLAIISVMTSKGFQDFNNVLSDYKEKYKPFTRLFPALLQGDKAVESMMQALAKVQQYAHLFDAVLILRGGGSDIGLNAYDSYEFAAAVATFPLPVITGIGHSTNETVVEMVAWKNMITPTETAYFLMSRYSDFEQSCTKAFNTIATAVRNKIKQHQQRLSQSAQQIQRLTTQKTQKAHHQLLLLKGHIKTLATNILKNNERRLATTTELLVRLPAINIQNAQNKLDITTIKARIFDPAAVLKKGFSITKHRKHTIVNLQSLKQGDAITTYLQSGKINSVIKKITPNE
ncbi:MAG: exodeoxyribonuclease VII large subunit [Bacteroidales bacterium]|nr:exodeoxyribonuclease VII large subunit [Bacteroidales bacterium]